MVRAMRRNGPRIRVPRSRIVHPWLRLLASLLAGVGLLGHGLAMLLVSLLAGPAAADGVQGADFPAFVEICAADGQVRLAPSGLPGNDSDGTGQTGHGSGAIKTCPICSTFAQNGPADLPAPAVLSAHALAATPAQPAPGILRTGREGLRPLSRGPPAAA